MPRKSLHEKWKHDYIHFMAIRDMFALPDTLEALAAQFDLDARSLQQIRNTRYLNGRTAVLKMGSLKLAWEYRKNHADHGRFVEMLWVSPHVFDILLYLIQDHPIFQNNSNNPQTPVQTQLAVTLYRLGRYGNAASLADIARNCGISEGSVENFTHRCFTAIESLHAVLTELGLAILVALRLPPITD
ncbi:hypothetical protein EW146_g2130 [Bondarzewia mesenterica]|uniref:Uncharacterized protein n=1 Tax=Bondarzewia mesenterica TaxID=1095465 RepID=A0A4S4M3F4_9AGAM|nr:hypothetical protein EW146_g2130 [Bondarzewia mesenterica]